jgi:hypothetical protein
VDSLLPPVLRDGFISFLPSSVATSSSTTPSSPASPSSGHPLCPFAVAKPRRSRRVRQTFFFNNKNDGTTVFSSIETRGVTGNGRQPTSGTAVTERERM